jgi:DNA-binding transcriptional ArsR family regulator
MSEPSSAPDPADAGDADTDGGDVAGPDAERGLGAEPDVVGASAPADGHQGDSDARVVGLESTDAADVIGAVGSETARLVLEAIHDDPATASGLADRLDCSLQTVQYHLGNLTEAGLVEVVDETASEKGRTMDVYGPANRPVVVYAGDEDEADLRSMLARLVSAVGLLAVASLVVQRLLDRASTRADAGTEVGMTADAAREAGGAAGGIEPGLLFFAGGMAALVAYLGWWYLRRSGRLDGL